MLESTRRRVVAVVGTVLRKQSPALHSYTIGGYGSLAEGDFDSNLREWASRSVHFPAGKNDCQFDFWDPDTSAHVQMMLTENTLWGFDFHTSCHFSGTLQGRMLALYDYQSGQRYDFYL